LQRKEKTSLDLSIGIGAIVAGGLLAISLFFDWYELSGGGSSLSLSGWQALETSDVLLFLIGVGAIVLSGRRLLDPARREIPPILLLGGFAVVLVLSLFIWDIPVVEIAKHGEGNGLQSDIQAGGWLALVGSVGLLIAGLLEATVRSITTGQRNPGPTGASVPPADEPPTQQL
jgi:hypothetical protein